MTMRLVTLAAALVLVGCTSTPSVHPVNTSAVPPAASETGHVPVEVTDASTALRCTGNLDPLTSSTVVKASVFCDDGRTGTLVVSRSEAVGGTGTVLLADGVATAVVVSSWTPSPRVSLSGPTRVMPAPACAENGSCTATSVH
jgi:hypothetical protein